MIHKDDMIKSILAASPSYQEVYDRSKFKEFPDVVLGDWARHLVSLQARGCVGELKNAFRVVEEFIIHGDVETWEAAVVGILESVQGCCQLSGIDAEFIRAYLGAQSVKWWNSLIKFWKKEIPYVGYDLRD